MTNLTYSGESNFKSDIKNNTIKVIIFYSILSIIFNIIKHSGVRLFNSKLDNDISFKWWFFACR